MGSDGKRYHVEAKCGHCAHIWDIRREDISEAGRFFRPVLFSSLPETDRQAIENKLLGLGAHEKKGEPMPSFFKPDDFKAIGDCTWSRLDSAEIANKRLENTGIIEAAVNIMEKSAFSPGPTMTDYYRLAKALEPFGFKFLSE